MYNAVSAFALIENLEYITVHFSGSGYSVTRQTIEQNYPNYKDIFADNSIDMGNFSQYVEQKMNDRGLILEMFGLFEKIG